MTTNSITELNRLHTIFVKNPKFEALFNKSIATSISYFTMILKSGIKELETKIIILDKTTHVNAVKKLMYNDTTDLFETTYDLNLYDYKTNSMYVYECAEQTFVKLLECKYTATDQTDFIALGPTLRETINISTDDDYQTHYL